MNVIREIILCGISNDTGGVYGTEEYLKGTFDPAFADMQPSFDVMSIWWHPALATLYLFFPSGAIWLLVINLIVMFDYADYFTSMHIRLRSGGDISGGDDQPDN